MKNVTPKRFREMREDMGYSRALIAKWFDVSYQTLWRWERSKGELPGPAKILMWLLYEEQVNGNKDAIRAYLRSVMRKR